MLTKNARVSYLGRVGVLAGFRLGQVGGVDADGNGVLEHAMVGDVELLDEHDQVVEMLTDVPLRDLQYA